MSRKEKLIARLLQMPSDYSFEEAEALLKCLGYAETNAGRTSGSRVRFERAGGGKIILHRPHPGNVMKHYQIKQLIEILKKEELI